jgi:hypothetical protein
LWDSNAGFPSQAEMIIAIDSGNWLKQLTAKFSDEARSPSTTLLENMSLLGVDIDEETGLNVSSVSPSAIKSSSSLVNKFNDDTFAMFRLVNNTGLQRVNSNSVPKFINENGLRMLSDPNSSQTF